MVRKVPCQARQGAKLAVLAGEYPVVNNIQEVLAVWVPGGCRTG